MPPRRDRSDYENEHHIPAHGGRGRALGRSGRLSGRRLILAERSQPDVRSTHAYKRSGNRALASSGSSYCARATVDGMSTSPLHAISAASRREYALVAAYRGYGNGVGPLPDKLAAIRDACGVFDDHGVAYALIGGVAVGIRSGVPRATLDVDFAVPVTSDFSALVEAFHDHHLRHAGRRHHPRGGEGVHLDRVGARQRGRDLVTRGRPLAQRALGSDGWQLQLVLDGCGADRADGGRRREWSGHGGNSARCRGRARDRCWPKCRVT